MKALQAIITRAIGNRVVNSERFFMFRIGRKSVVPHIKYSAVCGRN